MQGRWTRRLRVAIEAENSRLVRESLTPMKGRYTRRLRVAFEAQESFPPSRRLDRIDGSSWNDRQGRIPRWSARRSQEPPY